MNMTGIVHSLPRFLRRHKLVRLLLFISPRSNVQLVTFNGSAKLFADMRDPFARNYFLIRGFDPEFFSIAKPFLRKGGIFFDVGANFGFCSFGLIGCLDRNDVEFHLFEANSGVCELLSRSASLYPNQDIFVNRCCVTDTPGVSKLNLSYDNFGSSYISDNGTQEVENLILDNYIRSQSIKKINLLKIDVEGWEVRALRGVMDSLKAGVVDAIYLEVSTENLSRAGSSAGECFNLLRDAGFHLFYVKRNDLESSFVHKSETVNLDINGSPLPAARLENFPANHLTDVLAIHKFSEFLRDNRGWEG